jgi:hypothetical protein
MSETTLVRFDGYFALGWLAPGELAYSAGDGTGAWIVESVEGSRRVEVGDELEVPSGLARPSAVVIAEKEQEILRLRGWLERIYQQGRGPHVELARRALNGDSDA